jgi:hypothetical protein
MDIISVFYLSEVQAADIEDRMDSAAMAMFL